MSRTGPRLRDQDTISALGVDMLVEPIVADLARAAAVLHCDPAQLAAAVASAALQPWGSHASGAPVFRWPELCQAAAAVGINVPATRPTLSDWRGRQVAKRERAKQQQKRNRQQQR